MEYLRIGTDYYKMVAKPNFENELARDLIKWKKAEIITDKGKDFLNSVPRYDGYTNLPSHTNYERKVGEFYNRYHELEHNLCPGDFNTIKFFLKHIFSDQYQLALDYLTILWKYPKQILPVLCLVSNQRNTGKSTFLNFLKLIFEHNLTVNTNEDFRGKFNSDWAYKLLICIDEVLLDKREDSERLKYLSTAKSLKAEAKGVDKAEIPFFGKFILCSNNEDSFIYIEKQEIRYWVVKVEPFEKEIHNLLEVLKNELSHFLYFLDKRHVKSLKKTRMWFSPHEIHTTALETLKKGNRNSTVKEIIQLLQEEFEKYNVDELFYTATDLVNMLKNNNYRTTTFKVAYHLKENFNLDYINSSYKKYNLSINPFDNSMIVNSERHKGRYYTFSKESILKF